MCCDMMPKASSSSSCCHCYYNYDYCCTFGRDYLHCHQCWPCFPPPCRCRLFPPAVSLSGSYSFSSIPLSFLTTAAFYLLHAKHIWQSVYSFALYSTVCLVGRSVISTSTIICTQLANVDSAAKMLLYCIVRTNLRKVPTMSEDTFCSVRNMSGKYLLCLNRLRNKEPSCPRRVDQKIRQQQNSTKFISIESFGSSSLMIEAGT